MPGALHDTQGNDAWLWADLLGDDFPPEAVARLTAAGDWDESRVSRGGDPENPGRFSDRDGGDSSGVSPTEAASRVQAALLEGTGRTKFEQLTATATQREAKAENERVIGARLTRMLDERPALRAEFDRQMTYPTTNRGVNPLDTYPSTVGRDLQVRDAMDRVIAAKDAGDATARAVVDEKPVLDNRDRILEWAETHGGLAPMEELWGRETADRYQASWASTASGNSPISLALQVAAGEELGVTSGRFDEYLNRDDGQDRAWRTNQVLDDERETMRAFVRAEYDNTQDWLAKQGLHPDDRVEVYRGMRFDGLNHAGIQRDVAPPAEFPTEWDRAKQVQVDLNPVSSWSIDRDVAALRYFSGPGGYILTDRVRVRDILSTPRSGRGTYPEGEILIRNRPGQKISVRRNPPEGAPDEAAGMMP